MFFSIFSYFKYFNSFYEKKNQRQSVKGCNYVLNRDGKVCLCVCVCKQEESFT